ncbi:solute carrier family 2, facilitated glucose transporter member 3-like isoform X2 [Toxorhynchites rutilus septentrionalis]|nr:solute carrier family 2, facilitated glucose transporter member 3-like isoform X2 [Toxorhynchites rutilus septentrionalis]
MDLSMPDSGWTTSLFTLGVTSTLGVSIPVGFNLGVINALSEYIKEWNNATLYEQHRISFSTNALNTVLATIVSIFLIGGVLGSLGAAFMADRFGRKKSYLLCGVLQTLGGVCFLCCRTFSSITVLLIGRIIVGISAGLTTGILPMYLSEVSPTKLRGTISTLCGLGLTAGVVVGQIASLEQILGTADNWHLALSSYTLLNAFCFLPYYWLPESPKYLYSIKNDSDGALREIRKIFGRDSIDDDYIKLQMEPHTKQVSIESTSPKRSFWSVMADPSLLLPLMLVCALQGGQQLSGISAVFFYSVSIFESVGLSSSVAKFANLGVGCLNLFISFLGPYLMAKFNRRTLSLLSISSCAVNLCSLTMVLQYIDAVSWFKYACISIILLYIVGYQIGLGPIPFFIGAELFEQSSRPAAMALGSLSSWGCNFLLGIFFPVMQSAWGAFVFVPCSLSCALLTTFVKYYLPETRGRDVSDVAVLVSKGFKSKVL